MLQSGSDYLSVFDKTLWNSDESQLFNFNFIWHFCVVYLRVIDGSFVDEHNCNSGIYDTFLYRIKTYFWYINRSSIINIGNNKYLPPIYFKYI